MTKIKYEVIEVNNVDITVDVSMLTSSESLFFNATEIAKQYDRKPNEFLRKSENVEYLTALISEKSVADGVRYAKSDFIKTKTGGNNQGTWLHNDLALQFARWLSPTFSVKLDQWIKKKLKEEEGRKRERLASKTGYLELSQSVLESHDDPKFYHFSNEADLINRIVLGMTSKQYKEKHEVENVRDNLDFEQIRQLEKLQRMDSSLIELGLSFKDRKEKLMQYYETKLLEV